MLAAELVLFLLLVSIAGVVYCRYAYRLAATRSARRRWFTVIKVFAWMLPVQLAGEMVLSKMQRPDLTLVAVLKWSILPAVFMAAFASFGALGMAVHLRWLYRFILRFGERCDPRLRNMFSWESISTRLRRQLGEEHPTEEERSGG